MKKSFMTSGPDFGPGSNQSNMCMHDIWQSEKQ